MPWVEMTGLRPGRWKSRIPIQSPNEARTLARTQPIGNHAPGRETVRLREDMALATLEDFDALDIRVGTIVDVQPFPQARKPAYKLMIDFGPAIGTKRSSAQITVHYTPELLLGRQVMAVVNFPPRQIGPFISEVLTLGVPDENGAVVLLEPRQNVPNGGRMF